MFLIVRFNQFFEDLEIIWSAFFYSIILIYKYFFTISTNKKKFILTLVSISWIFFHQFLKKKKKKKVKKTKLEWISTIRNPRHSANHLS